MAAFVKIHQYRPLKHQPNQESPPGGMKKILAKVIWKEKT
jgi:hypothetical protein